ncbi:MAG: signal peptide peptidase SppA [Candidatus Paracaedimonas acanthamoebae]|uniref:Signal peptide peptidase SppA n=1 Tax=Candidatus Paracaedimonas acanthamoebae TaxID=244581 RepID=A0A8J7TUL6_9PROT|nr:signal peptide peptidase SppA [Candidatus Paracaedimonas acanthamoebae]
MGHFFKKFLVVLGGITLFSIVLSLSGIIFASFKTLKVQDNSYLELSFDGDLEEKTAEGLQSFFSPHVSLRSVVETLTHASQDPKIVGILLRLNQQSPAGFGQIQELRNALKRFSQKGKKVIVHCDTFGESSSGMAAYYLASVGQEIWLQSLGSLNITGFGVEIPFLRKFLDDYGVTARILRREGYKTAMDFLTHEGLSPQNREDLEKILTARLKQFITDISQDRQLNPSHMREYIDRAPIVTAETAKKMGLIDHIGYIEDLYTSLKAKMKEAGQFVQFKKYAESLPKIKAKNKIAIIYAVGPIMRTSERGNPLSLDAVTKAEEVRKAFEEALKDPHVKAIVFRINSPGGSAVASDTIWGAAEQAKIKGIPVIASMGDVAASGGYMVALPAKKIVANPATITGSIGVYGGKLVTNALWEKLKIHWQSVQVGQKAMIWNSVKDYSKEELEAVNESLDQIYDIFMQRVSVARKLPLNEVRKLAQGHVWTGDEALSRGLVDVLGDMELAITIAKEEVGLKKDEVVKLEIFPRETTLIEKLRMLLTGNSSSLSLKGGVYEIFKMIKVSFKSMVIESLYSPLSAYFENN